MTNRRRGAAGAGSRRCRRRGGYVACSIACAVSPSSARRGVCATRWRCFGGLGGGEARRGTGGGRHIRVRATAGPAAVGGRAGLPQPDDRATDAALAPASIASCRRWTPTHSMRRCGTSRRRAKRPTGPWPSTASRPRSTARAAPTRTDVHRRSAWWRGRYGQRWRGDPWGAAADPRVGRGGPCVDARRPT